MSEPKITPSHVTLNFPVPAELSSKRLIGLGEVTHGSGGLHELASAIMEKLIVDFRARTILFEAPFGVVERINQLVSRGETISPSDIKDFYFNWRSKEILAFFNRLSQLQRQGRSINIIGIDIRQPASDLKKIKNLTTELSEFPVIDPSVPSFAEYERNILAKKERLPKELAGRLISKLNDLEKHLSIKASDDLLMSVRRLKFWVRTYSHLSHDNEYDLGFLSRDQGMAEMAEHYLSTDGTPTIVWAHLAHLVFDSRTVDSEHSWFKVGDLLGSILKKKLGSNYSLVALMARETEVSLVTGEKHTFHPTAKSLESKGPQDLNLVTLFSPHQLRDENFILVGSTTDEDNPAKQTYIKMQAREVEQFDYAAIRSRSAGLTDAIH